VAAVRDAVHQPLHDPAHRGGAAVHHHLRAVRRAERPVPGRHPLHRGAGHVLRDLRPGSQGNVMWTPPLPAHE
jgi:hypothetical protein